MALEKLHYYNFRCIRGVYILQSRWICKMSMPISIGSRHFIFSLNQKINSLILRDVIICVKDVGTFMREL